MGWYCVSVIFLLKKKDRQKNSRQCSDEVTEIFNPLSDQTLPPLPLASSRPPIGRESISLPHNHYYIYLLFCHFHTNKYTSLSLSLLKLGEYIYPNQKRETLQKKLPRKSLCWEISVFCFTWLKWAFTHIPLLLSLPLFSYAYTSELSNIAPRDRERRASKLPN